MKLPLIITIAIVVLIIIIFIVYLSAQKYKKNQRKNNIIKLFTIACENAQIKDYKLEYVKKNAYDFYFEDAKDIFYIKVVDNFSNHEICVNNATKWQIRNLTDNLEKVNYVEGIEALIRMDNYNTNKRVHKLFIIYPNSRALLKVINECEVIFINPDTDVYGSNIITYKRLEETPDLLNL